MQSLGQKLQSLNKLFSKFIGIIQFQMLLEELRKDVKLVEKSSTSEKWYSSLALSQSSSLRRMLKHFEMSTGLSLWRKS